MSVDLAAARPLTVKRTNAAATAVAPGGARDVALLQAAGVSDAAARLPRRRRRPGAHREPGSNPWRTGIRELVMAVTWGHLVVFRPVHLVRPAH